MFGHIFFLCWDLYEAFCLVQRGTSQASETPIIASDEDLISPNGTAWAISKLNEVSADKIAA